MKKRVVNKPTKVGDLTFEDLYEEISSNWQDKARKLRVRRMRAMQRSLNEKPFKKNDFHAR